MVQTVSGILAFIVIVVNIRRARQLYLWAGLSFFLLGFLFYLIYVPKEVGFFNLFGSMTGLLALLFVLPFMSTIIAAGKYDRALGQMISKPPTLNMVRLYRRTSVMSYMLTLFLNVATVPVVVATVKSKLSQLSSAVIQRFFAHSILRAYALVLLWSPTEILVASTIDLTGTSYVALLPTLLMTSVLFLSIDWLLHNRQLKGGELIVQQEPIRNPKLLRRKLMQLAIAIMSFIVLLLAVNACIPQSFLFSVTVLIIPFTFLWAMVTKRPRRFKKLAFLYLKGNTTQLHSLFFLFLAAGFFVEVFPYTVWFEYMNAFFAFTYQQGSLFLFYLLVGLCIFGFALVGFHPLISIAILSPFLQEQVAAYPYGISLLLIGVGLGTVMIGPFNVTPTILAMQLNANPYSIIRKNFAFAFSYLLFIVMLAYACSLMIA